MVDKSIYTRIYIKILEFSKDRDYSNSKKLFFNLKKLKNQIAPQAEGDLRDEHVNEIANKLDVNKDEVISMNRRLSGKEFSLNAPVGEDGDEWQDWLVDKGT